MTDRGQNPEMPQHQQRHSAFLEAARLWASACPLSHPGMVLVLAEESQGSRTVVVPRVWSCGWSWGCDLAQQRCLAPAAPADANTPVHCSSPWEPAITANDGCLNGSPDDKHGADPATAAWQHRCLPWLAPHMPDENTPH